MAWYRTEVEVRSRISGTISGHDAEADARPADIHTRGGE